MKLLHLIGGTIGMGVALFSAVNLLFLSLFALDHLTLVPFYGLFSVCGIVLGCVMMKLALQDK